MALRRVFLPRLAAPRIAALSTEPQAREQPSASPGPVRGCGTAEPARRPVPVVDFSNTQEAYRSRRSWELARNLLVLRLCAAPALLAHHEQVRGWVIRWAGAARGRRRGQRVTQVGRVRRGRSSLVRSGPGKEEGRFLRAFSDLVKFPT